MEIQIRKATTEDLSSILEIVNDEILHRTAIYDYEERTWEEQAGILQHYQQHNFPFLVAVMEESVVGYGSYGTFRTKAGFNKTVEHSIYVNQKYLGKQIGSRLMDALLEIAVQQDVKCMVAMIDGSNQGSVKFHERYGFALVGTMKDVGYKFGRFLDLIVMQKNF